MTFAVPAIRAACGVVVDLFSGFTSLRMGLSRSLRSASLRLARCAVRLKLKLRISCTHKFLSSDSFWINTPVCGSRIFNALAKATLPVAGLLVSSLASLALIQEPRNALRARRLTPFRSTAVKKNRCIGAVSAACLKFVSFFLFSSSRSSLAASGRSCPAELVISLGFVCCA